MALPLAAIGLGITAASSLASIGSGIFNSVQQNKANKANAELQQQTYDMQREQNEWNRQKAERDFEYNKQLQQEIFQREDNAVQRRVADNRNAGLSPIAGLAGANAGTALEANTPQLSQTFDTPQMSANQLNVDFSSLNQLGSQIQNYELNKSQLAIQQQKLDLEKSSNEANLKQMEQNIQATKLENQYKQAVMDNRITASRLSNQKMEKEITKVSYDAVNSMLSADGKKIMNARSEKELAEWVENAGLRDELGKAVLNNTKYSLEEKKARLALATLVEGDNHEKNLAELSVIQQNLKEMKSEYDVKYGVKNSLESMGVSSQTSGAWQHFFDLMEGLMPSNWNLFSK